MPPPSSRRRTLAVLLVLLGVLVGACGGDSADDPDVVAPDPTPTVSVTPAAPTVAPRPTVEASSAPDARPEAACVRELALRVRIGQLVMPMVTPAEYPLVVDLAQRHEIGSVALLGSPTGDELALLRDARAVAGALPLLVASDEEGGRVQRLVNVLGPLPTAASLPPSTSPAETRSLFADYGLGMVAQGVTMALAPVVDVGGGPGIESRSLSDDPAVVVEYAGAVIAGYRDAGVTPVLKHFPGHGRASADTHDGLAETPDLDELRSVDLVPYAALLAPDVAVMVGHLVVPGLTEGLPASLSPSAIDGLLRDELGFDGLVVTDALNMGAITGRWTTPAAMEQSLLAGADLGIVDGLGVVDAVVAHLLEAVEAGRLTEERIDRSVLRVLAAKGLDPCVVSAEL